MTSNIGSEHILEGKDNNIVLEELKKYFKPEFINRIDEIIMFNSLNKDILSGIIDKIIKEINVRLEDRHISIKLTDKAKKYIIDNSYDPVYGARPVKRYISKNIETLIAYYLIDTNSKANKELTIDVENDKFEIK